MASRAVNVYEGLMPHLIACASTTPPNKVDLTVLMLVMQNHVSSPRVCIFDMCVHNLKLICIRLPVWRATLIWHIIGDFSTRSSLEGWMPWTIRDRSCYNWESSFACCRDLSSYTFIDHSDRPHQLNMSPFARILRKFVGFNGFNKYSH